MNVKVTSKHDVVSVKLSRRNLIDLLTALDASDSSRPPLLVKHCEGIMLYVQVEEDTHHYNKGTVAGPGITYPACKEF